MAEGNKRRRRRTREEQSVPNIRTVAQKASVSIATVSRTVNNVGTVEATTAKRVWKAIRDLGYLPNRQARSLGSGKSRLFGLIVSDITNSFLAELIQEFEKASAEIGYDVLISSRGSEPQHASAFMLRMLERQAEGVAVMSLGNDGPPIPMRTERNLPQVFLDEGPDRPGISLLRVDYDDGIRQAVQHLVVLGHREIAFVNGPPRPHIAQLRLIAFQRALAGCGLLPRAKWLIYADHSAEGGVAAAERLMSGGEMPTAVICSNDITAIGMLQWLHFVGIKVPDDLSVVGFNDIQRAQTMIPSLTTLRLSSFELSCAAVAALRSHGGKETRHKREYFIRTNLVVRESTSRPRDDSKT